jgi:formylglycine-generating enzyme required for sulfatase activity
MMLIGPEWFQSLAEAASVYEGISSIKLNERGYEWPTSYEYDAACRGGLKSVSGYGGVKLAKCLTGKELCDFGVFKK